MASQRGALMVRRRGGSLSGCRLHIDVMVAGDSPRKAPSSVGVQRRVSPRVISGLAEKQKAAPLNPGTLPLLPRLDGEALWSGAAGQSYHDDDDATGGAPFAVNRRGPGGRDGSPSARLPDKRGRSRPTVRRAPLAPNVPPRKATLGGWKFAALFCVHNLPGGVPENVEFLIMPRAGRWSARPVFLIVHDSLTRPTRLCHIAA